MRRLLVHVGRRHGSVGLALARAGRRQRGHRGRTRADGEQALRRAVQKLDTLDGHRGRGRRVGAWKRSALRATAAARASARRGNRSSPITQTSAPYIANPRQIDTAALSGGAHMSGTAASGVARTPPSSPPPPPPSSIVQTYVPPKEPPLVMRQSTLNASVLFDGMTRVRTTGSAKYRASSRLGKRRAA